jgi:hypothetical protein
VHRDANGTGAKWANGREADYTARKDGSDGPLSLAHGVAAASLLKVPGT